MIPAARCPSEFRRAERDRVHRLCPGLGSLSTMTASWAWPSDGTHVRCYVNHAPKCRHDHRLKQHPKWTVDQLPDGTFTWTTPAGRTYATEPTRYPI